MFPPLKVVRGEEAILLFAPRSWCGLRLLPASGLGDGYLASWAFLEGPPLWPLFSGQAEGGGLCPLCPHLSKALHLVASAILTPTVMELPW